MSALKEKPTAELRGRLEAINNQMHEALQQGQDGDRIDMSKVTALDGADSAAKVEQLRELNREASDIGAELDERKDLVAIGERLAEQRGLVNPFTPPTKGREEKGEIKSIGELFTTHAAFQKVSRGQMGPDANFDDFDLGSILFQTSTGWAPPAVRTDKFVDYPTRPLAVATLMPTIPVNTASYVYMAETGFVNSAAEVAEGGSKPEGGLAAAERTEAIRKIAVYLGVTDEQLDDVPAARAYIDNRLGYMVRQRLDGQALTGDGVSPNIAGIIDNSRTGIQTQAKGGDPTPDAVYKAMTKIRVNAFTDPDAAVFHPNDWQDIRLLRTSDGIYIWGNPADAGPERIWGLKVVQTVAMTENTALVGDFQAAALLLRHGLTMKVGYVNDDLIKNKQTIVAELRAGVAVFVEPAFCTVTGI